MFGARTADSVFPGGMHKTKQYVSAEGAGYLDSLYPDTTEMIKRDQDKGVSQAKKYPIKPGYRN
jgi:hypothetical protein